MADFPFLATYVQGQLARLLSRSELEELSQATSFEALIAGLERDAAERFEKVAHRRGTLESFVATVRADTIASLRQVFAFARAEEADDYLRHLIALFEVDDVKTLMRGHLRKVSFEELSVALSGFLDFDPETVADVYGEVGDGFFTSLARLPLHPFVRAALRSIPFSGSLQAHEQQLEREVFQHIFAALEEKSDPAIAFAVAGEADIRNIRLALHFAGTAEAQKVRSFCLDGGHLGGSFYDRLFKLDSTDDVLEALTKTFYGPAIQKGVIIYASLDTVLVFDRLLEEALLRELASHSLIKPVSLWPVLRYIYRLRNEKKNLSLLLRLKFHKFPIGTIREMLVYA